MTVSPARRRVTPAPCRPDADPPPIIRHPPRTTAGPEPTDKRRSRFRRRSGPGGPGRRPSRSGRAGMAGRARDEPARSPARPDAPIRRPSLTRAGASRADRADHGPSGSGPVSGSSRSHPAGEAIAHPADPIRRPTSPRDGSGPLLESAPRRSAGDRARTEAGRRRIGGSGSDRSPRAGRSRRRAGPTGRRGSPDRPDGGGAAVEV